MLDTFVSQAAGLQSLSPQLAPKLIAVASHGQQQGELPLLWSLCTTWVDLGYPVAVLDGHAQETDQNPGLAQMLADPMGHFQTDPDTVSWLVLPAAQGFAALGEHGFNSASVGDLLQNHGVVLLYASAATLTPLLKGSGMEPLVVVAPLQAAALSAYQALKQLLVDAQLRPTVANIALGNQTKTHMTSPAQKLQNCAQNFLGLAIKPLTVSASASSEDSRDEISRLALQLLENAMSLERHPMQRTH